MARLALNLVAFQIAWLACVLGGAHGLPWAGVAVAAGAVALHLYSSPAPGREAILVAAVAAVGALWDGLLVRFGFLEYPSGLLVPWLAPVWIVAMWAAFATTLNRSLAWLRGRSKLAFLFGGLGGPLAYYAGMRLGAVGFPDPVAALAVLAAGWSLLMPLAAWLALKLDRPGKPARPAAVPGQAAARPH